MLAVEGERLLLHPLRVVLVFRLDFLHERLDFLHFLHADGALVGERPEEEPDEDGEKDDGDAEVRHDGVEHVEDPDERVANPAPHSEFHDVLEAEVPEQGLLLGSDVEDALD